MLERWDKTEEDRRLDSGHCGPGTGLYLTGLTLGS